MTGHTSLILRTCAHDMTAHGGFVWPAEGPVEAPDWHPTPNCGGGLHGLLWGEGDGRLLDWSADARWLVVEVPTDTIIDLGGKVKFPAGTVVHCGDRHSATRFLGAHPDAQRWAIAGGTATAGYRGTATAGDCGTATAGDDGTATAGYRGTLLIWWHDGQRGRIAVGYIGENGLEAHTPYQVDETGRFVEVTP